jgi:hypothetical protein
MYVLAHVMLSLPSSSESKDTWDDELEPLLYEAFDCKRSEEIVMLFAKLS